MRIGTPCSCASAITPTVVFATSSAPETSAAAAEPPFLEQRNLHVETGGFEEPHLVGVVRLCAGIAGQRREVDRDRVGGVAPCAGPRKCRNGRGAGDDATACNVHRV